MTKKFYTVLLEWTDVQNGRITDTGCEITLITDDRQKAQEEFDRLVLDEKTQFGIDREIVSDCENYFHNHGEFPAETIIRIIEPNRTEVQ